MRFRPAAMLMGLLALGCAPRQDEPDAARQVLVIALDGADWSLFQRLSDQGRLPTLTRLAQQGSAGVLESIPPTVSPAVWTTISTGRRREAHGIYNFYFKAPGSYEKRQNRSSLRRTAAIWNILSEAGLSTGLARWHVTYPAEPVEGFVAAFRYQEHVTEGDERAFHPPELRDTVRALAASFRLPDHPFVRRVEAIPVERPTGKLSEVAFVAYERAKLLRSTFRRDTRVTHIAVELIRRDQPNLTMVYLNGIDWLSHWFWGFNEDSTAADAFDPSGEQARLFSGLVEDYYAYTDHLVATLVEAVSFETDVVVLSDHGFRELRLPEDAYLEINLLLADLGYLQFSAPAKVDYARSAAFNFSDVKLDDRSIYLNLSGREAEGTVPTGKRLAVTESLVETLRGLRTVQGEPVFEEVRVNEVSAGELPQRPDIEVRRNPRLRMTDRLRLGEREFPMRRFLDSSPVVSGNHREQGILVVAGPSFRPGASGDATILDVAPTLLTLFRLPVAEDMPGRVLTERLNAPTPLPSIPSYEGRVTRAADPEIESLSAETEERLRSLGYID